MERAVGLQKNGQAAGSKLPLLELEDSMSKLDQIDKKLKCSEEDRQELKKELQQNKNENLDNYINLARATEKKAATDVEKGGDNRQGARKKYRERHIEKMKRRYENVNDNLWNIETTMVTVSRDKAESSCAIQSKLDPILRNSIAREKTIPD